MYGNNSFMVDRLIRQKEEIDNLIRTYQSTGQQTPVNNFINTNQTQNTSKDFVEWRVLNENEEVDNLYVSNKTLFINDNMMVLKDTNGQLQKWEVKKIYPKDKKDEKILELENKIKEQEMKVNEHSESTITTRERNKSYANDDEYVKSEPKTAIKYFSNEE